ncbi:MAG: TIGR03086 family metal-binding protein, partial [Stackebrandtia sp.]
SIELIAYADTVSQGTIRQLTALSPNQWEARTPCPEWSVRDIATHLHIANRRDTAEFRGGEPVDSAFKPGDKTVLGEDPVAALAASSADFLASFTDNPAVLDRDVTLPLGTVPGSVAVHVHMTDAVIHHWDIERATGVAAGLPTATVEATLAFMRTLAPKIPRDGFVFGPEQPCPEGASAADRLAALTGRSVL